MQSVFWRALCVGVLRDASCVGRQNQTICSVWTLMGGMWRYMTDSASYCVPLTPIVNSTWTAFAGFTQPPPTPTPAPAGGFLPKFIGQPIPTTPSPTIPTAPTTDEPFDIARSVAKIVETAANKRHVVTYLLPPLTTQGNVDRQKAVRATILSELAQQNTRFGHNVRIIDLNDSEYTLGLDGKSLTPESYIAIANTLI